MVDKLHSSCLLYWQVRVRFLQIGDKARIVQLRPAKQEGERGVMNETRTAQRRASGSGGKKSA
jgi:hypothetical protein